jgi:hypothetical protein
MKIQDTRNLIKYISYYFDEDKFKCSICFKIPNIFYLICKPDCTDNSYCKECIERLEKDINKCPFTNIYFAKKDIAIDYRKNRSFEIYRQVHKKLENKKIEININVKQ